MPKFPSGRSKSNESRYPYIVELAVGKNGLDAKLGRQIMQFHNARRIEPRHGSTTVGRDGVYYRYCFSDLSKARAFVEQFGGVELRPK